MALFTHQHSTNTPAEVNPAASYFSAVKICRNYVESRSAKRGTVCSSEYHALEREGYRFIAHVNLPGKMPRDVIMVKPAAVAVEANAQWYGVNFSAFHINKISGGLFRVIFSYDWDGFHPGVVAGDCDASGMSMHLMALAAPEDQSEVMAWLMTEDAKCLKILEARGND